MHYLGSSSIKMSEVNTKLLVLFTLLHEWPISEKLGVVCFTCFIIVLHAEKEKLIL